MRTDGQGARQGESVAGSIRRSGELAQGFGAAMAMHKSYVGISFLVLFLYFFFYLPGLIVNIIYLVEANGIRSKTGVQPSGTGCLQALIWIFFWLPIIGGVLFLLILLIGWVDL